MYTNQFSTQDEEALKVISFEKQGFSHNQHMKSIPPYKNRKKWLFTQPMLTNFHMFVSTNLRYIKRFKSHPLFNFDHFIQ